MADNNFHSAQKFSQYVRNQRITKAKIASDLQLSPQHIGKVLLLQRELSTTLRDRLNAYLRTNF